MTPQERVTAEAPPDRAAKVANRVPAHRMTRATQAKIGPAWSDRRIGCLLFAGVLVVYLAVLRGAVESYDTQAMLSVTTNLVNHASFKMFCLLYTSPSPRDGLLSRMPSSA